MNDRLKDLRAGAAAPESVALEVKSTTSNPMATQQGGSGGGEQSDFMKQFFADVELVKKNIMEVAGASQKVKQINQEVVLATTPEKEQELSASLSPMINATNKKAAVAKQLLQSLREETERQKTSTDGANGRKNAANELRIRENLVNTLTRKFVEVMKAYQNSQQKYKTDIKKKMKRQLQIVKPDATPEEIEAVVTGGGASEIFKNSILKGGPSDSVKNASQHVQDKYQDVLALEASVAELHQMFLDFALLTEQQGEMLDQIEFQVKCASDFIDDGNEDMVQAIDYAIAIRKRQAICCVLVIVLIGIIVGVVFAVKK